VSPSEWAARIRSSLAKTVEAIVETGLLLAAARADLGHGHFLRMLRENVRISDDVAQQYLRIARDLVLANTDNWRYLPASRSALDALTSLDDQVKVAALADRRIHPGMTAEDVRHLGATATTTTRAKEWGLHHVRAALRGCLDRLEGCPLKNLDTVLDEVLAEFTERVEQLRSVYRDPLTPDDFEWLLTRRQELADAEAGQRFLQFDDAGKVVGALRQPSTFPQWMGRRTRADADRMIRAIDRLLGGQAAGMCGGQLLEASRRAREREQQHEGVQ